MSRRETTKFLQEMETQGCERLRRDFARRGKAKKRPGYVNRNLREQIKNIRNTREDLDRVTALDRVRDLEMAVTAFIGRKRR